MPRGRLPTHGQTGTPLYTVWAGMIQRCTNPNCAAYPLYSKLRVCDGWRKFEPFREWAKKGYNPGLTLDRKDNSKGYSPDNCRWASRSVQAQNRGKRKGPLSSKYIGVTKRGRRWRAQVNLQGEVVFAETFDKELDAAKGRDKFVVDNSTQHQLNFPRNCHE